jgi:hypothetical protein
MKLWLPFNSPVFKTRHCRIVLDDTQLVKLLSRGDETLFVRGHCLSRCARCEKVSSPRRLSSGSAAAERRSCECTYKEFRISCSYVEPYVMNSARYLVVVCTTSYILYVYIYVVEYTVQVHTVHDAKCGRYLFFISRCTVRTYITPTVYILLYIECRVYVYGLFVLR